MTTGSNANHASPVPAVDRRQAPRLAKETEVFLDTFKVGPNECNCSIVACSQTKEALVVDPGGSAEEILKKISDHQLKVKYILITHAHFDHVIAARAVRDATGAEICLHRDDIWLYRIMPLQYKLVGVKDKRPPRPNRWLNDGDQFSIGSLTTRTLHTPGHSPGSCSFHLSAEKVLFSGDTLFRESVGAWEVPGGSFEALVRSIKDKLFVLPDDTRVIPGHKEETTIGFEKQNNRYMKPEFIAEAMAKETQRPGTVKMFLLVVGAMLGIIRPRDGRKEG